MSRDKSEHVDKLQICEQEGELLWIPCSFKDEINSKSLLYERAEAACYLHAARVPYFDFAFLGSRPALKTTRVRRGMVLRAESRNFAPR